MPAVLLKDEIKDFHEYFIDPSESEESDGSDGSENSLEHTKKLS